jgi:GPH family glycoside/pentoside/hexuronide:cation symporter
MSSETKTQPLKKESVSKGKMFSFGMGPFTTQIMYLVYNYLIFYYYEVELGLSTTLVGLSFIIYAVWNMVNDPLLGFFTDKPRKWSSKYGLRFPWIMFGGALQIICLFFIFWIPDIGDPKSNPWPLFWYMVLITCLLDTFYSIFHSNYVGGFANIFRTPEQRRKGSTIVTFFGIFGQFLVVGLIIPMTIIIGDPSSYIRLVLIICVLLTVALIIFIPGVHESELIKKRYLQIYEFLDSQKLPYFKLLKIAFKEKNWVIYITVFSLQITASFLWMGSTLYLMRDVLHLDISVLTLASLALMITAIPSILFWSWVAKRTAHSNVTTIALFIMASSCLVIMVITDAMGFILVHVLMGLAAGAWASVLMSWTSDSNDSVVNAVGRHVESTLVGIRNFFNRIAYIIMGSIIAGVHIATGYVPGASQQTELALIGIRIHTGLIPFIILVTGGILMLKFYDLKGEKKIALLESIKKKGL